MGMPSSFSPLATKALRGHSRAESCGDARKHDFRLWHCFLKGFQDDQLTLMLAAAAWNFRKWMRLFTLFWPRLLCSLPTRTFYLSLQRIT